MSDPSDRSLKIHSHIFHPPSSTHHRSSSTPHPSSLIALLSTLIYTFRYASSKTPARQSPSCSLQPQLFPTSTRRLQIPERCQQRQCYTCLLANTRKSPTITSQGFRKMGEVSVVENGLAPVYIMGSHAPLSLFLPSFFFFQVR